MTSSIKTEYDGQVLIATFDNPRSELNLIDEEAHEDWLKFILNIRRKNKAKIILIKGTSRAFTGGGDFAMFERLNQDETKIDNLRRDSRLLVWDFLSIEQPIIFVGQGVSVGLGATIALLSDFILLGDSAQIIDPHVKVGLAAGDGGTGIWPLVMGPILAKKYLMTGMPLTAKDAERYGLATEVCPDDKVVESALNMAQQLAESPALAIKYTKLAINAHIRRALVDSFELSSALETVNFFTEEHQDAFNKFKKRLK